MKIINPIPYVFYALFFLIPLVFTERTSELFEFNKILILYTGATIIAFLWVLESIIKRRLTLKRTPLDIPLILFFTSQALATIFTFDFRTSLLGYYSRFYGGLASLGAILILYFAYSAFMDRKRTLLAIRIILVTAAVVAAWAVLEHYGKSVSCLLLRGDFDTSCWVQKVSERVFATFGQPNWLAAFLAAVIPFSWYFVQKSWESAKIKSYLALILSVLFLASLLYTKSRSGVAAFAVSFVIFWGLRVMRSKDYKMLLTAAIIFAGALAVIGTPWTPGIVNMKDNGLSTAQNTPSVGETSLETGGTESGEIRKIVWRGALDLWRAHPLTGTGVETFAYAYYNAKPPEQNLVSEWDFIYNKAHNEYLNYLSTSGLLGAAAYIWLIAVTLKVLYKGTVDPKISAISSSALAGYAALLVSNFFGFSVTATGVLLFLIPAFVFAFQNEFSPKALEFKKTETPAKAAMAAAFLLFLFVLLSLLTYFRADTKYAKGRSLNDQGKYQEAARELAQAISDSPYEAVYWMELAESDKNLAIENFEQNEPEKAFEHADSATREMKRAAELSPKNVSFKRLRSGYYTDLSELSSSYLLAANKELSEALFLAPTDAKIYYLSALVNLRMGNSDTGKQALDYALTLKPNYEIARLARAAIYAKEENYEKAKEDLTYILEYINPKSPIARQKLDELSKLP